MSDYAQQRIATAEVTNMINDIRKRHSVDIVIETTVDGAFVVKAWRHASGNRELAQFARRNCIGDALMEVDKGLSKSQA